MKEAVYQFILKALLAKDGEPMAELELRTAIRRAFQSLTFTEADLTVKIQHCEQQGWIIGSSDPLTGTDWLLTSKGKLRAAQLK
jgi:hypothetical protein